MKNSSRLAVAFCCLLSTASLADNIKKTLKFSIPFSSLGGYMASPSAGYSQVFSTIIATSDASNSPSKDPRFLVIMSEEGDRLTNPPDRSWISIVGPKGNVIESEPLPDAVQIKQSDCSITDPHFANTCPTLNVYAYTIKGLPNRAIINVSKRIYNNSTGSMEQITAIYSLNLNAAIGSSDRWTLVSSGSAAAFARPSSTWIVSGQIVQGPQLDTKNGWIIINDHINKIVQTYQISLN